MHGSASTTYCMGSDEPDAMLHEVEDHMRRGLDTLEAFVLERSVNNT